MSTDENGRAVHGSGRGDSGTPPEDRFDESAFILEADPEPVEPDRDDDTTAEPSASDTQPASVTGDLDAEPSDATDVDDVDWPTLWGLAGIPADERISHTQAVLAVETSPQTGVRAAPAAADLVSQAIEHGYLVGRQHAGKVVAVQLAPHLLEGDA